MESLAVLVLDGLHLVASLVDCLERSKHHFVRANGTNSQIQPKRLSNIEHL